MKKISNRSPNLTHRKDNLYVQSRNAIKFGKNSLGHLAHTHWTHCLKTSSNITSTKSLYKSKILCKCGQCNVRILLSWFQVSHYLLVDIDSHYTFEGSYDFLGGVIFFKLFSLGKSLFSRFVFSGSLWMRGLLFWGSQSSPLQQNEFKSNYSLCYNRAK